ncbi:AAA family ATPase [Gilvimarinus agarilyticus]|uniref:ATP-binding protein n=1 Tax=Gilvimarinus sp. 2_MG-2023 TaxID=3062666 RepID=UPI0026E42034|nr:AAA family ATPase [Gilvimarinus sp. 2_MG-2023]MBU2886757.1 AAA family ATPase [Gilvimarinus agarilyticus]MDO6571423.1 AAA family ATPase [Gilvimarinus sp. 2_MG-2023]
MNEELLALMENGVAIEHHHFRDVLSKVLRKIQHGRHDEITSVLGPTGVGKTTLINFLTDKLQDKQSNGWRDHLHPPIVVEAPAQTENSFPWREFLADLLVELGEDEVDSKVDLDHIHQGMKIGRDTRSGPKIGIAKLQDLLRKRVKALRPIAILVDESQNIVEGLPDKTRKANVNRLKTWANTMDTRLLFFGTHEARHLEDINEQLTRRISPIYFPRYRCDDDDERREFATFYASLVRHLGIPIDPKINDDFGFLINHSLGCPGILASWLQESIAYCIDMNQKKITPTILRKTRFSLSRLRTIEQAIKDFEVYHDSNFGDFNPFLVVGMGGQESMDYTPSSAKKVTKQRNNLKPGTQKPKRHQVHDTQN